MTSPASRDAAPTGWRRRRAAPTRTIVVNVQGDEPMLDPVVVDAVVRAAAGRRRRCPCRPSRCPCADVEEMLSPAWSRWSRTRAGDALYFSRSPIPFVRGRRTARRAAAAERASRRGLARKHVGLYAYRREALLRFAAPAPVAAGAGGGARAAARPAPRHGHPGGPCDGEAGRAVDTPQDLERVRELLAG